MDFLDKLTLTSYFGGCLLVFLVSVGINLLWWWPRQPTPEEIRAQALVAALWPLVPTLFLLGVAGFVLFSIFKPKD